METNSDNKNVENYQNDVNNEIEQKHGNFTVLLNGQRDLEQQLIEFKNSCDAHDKHQRKRCKRRYYNLALMAKVVTTTTDDELKYLLKNGTRTFLIDTVTCKPNEVEILVTMIRQAVEEQQLKEPCMKLVVGLAVEITGDCCRIGRIRNNCSVFLARGNTMTLTTNTAYKYAGFKEIAYVINLKYYLPALNLNDEILIGHEVRATIVKKLKTCVGILIKNEGIINSFDYIELPNQCNSLQLQSICNMFSMDLAMAQKVQADFIVMPRIRCIAFLKVLRCSLKQNYNFKLIGTIDLEYVSAKMLDLMALIKQLQFLWLTNLFNISQTMYTIICQDVIPLAKCLKKPIIGTVPLERCSEFRIFENHELLQKIDCMFIEKSRWRNKYPLIVKKLLPLRDYRMAAVENTLKLGKIVSSYESVVNFIIRTISSIECQAIFLYSKCENATSALGRVEIYCPVFILLPFDDIDEDKGELKCRLQLAKNLNLRRNLRVILYSREMNNCRYKPIEYGMEYARRCGCIETGDFIITLEVAQENGDENYQFGVGDDVVIMRAFYVPPLKVGEKFNCN